MMSIIQLFQSTKELRLAQLFSCFFRSKWRIVLIVSTCTLLLVLHYEIWATAGKEEAIANKSNVYSTLNTARQTDSSETDSNKICQQWVFDEVNWTLIYKKSFGKCEKLPPKTKVKRILFSNNTILYQGCTKTTKKCKERPHYSRRLKKRINTPPCCLQHVLDVFKHLSRRLRKSKIRYYLAAGGLIGWYRNGRIVPYDHDLDFMVEYGAWKSKKVRKLVQSLKHKYGYDLDLRKWNKIKIFYSKSNRVGMDLWPFEVKKKHGKRYVKIHSSYYKAQKYHSVFPLKSTTLNGIKTYVPNDPYHYINMDYGNGTWVKELLCKQKDRFGNCVT